MKSRNRQACAGGPRLNSPIVQGLSLALLLLAAGCSKSHPPQTSPVTLPESTQESSGGSPAPASEALAGDASFTLVLEAETFFAANDAADMVDHLESHGARATVREVTSDVITLDVASASDPQSVLTALSSVVLRVSPVLNIDEHRSPVVEALLDSSRARVDSHSLVGGCSDLAAYNQTSIGACRFILERAGANGQCQMHCLSTTPLLTSGDVQGASVSSDSMGFAVIAVLTDDASRRFGDFTGSHIGERLAIEVDGEVLAAPVIQTRLDSQFQVSMSADDTRQDAERLAAGLRPGAVRSAWRLVRIE